MSRILNMIGRGILRSARATDGYFRELSMSLAADDTDGIHQWQPYGLESRPTDGAEGIVLAMSGNADHLVAFIAGKSSLDLGSGETAVYNQHGWSMQLLQDRAGIVLNDVFQVEVNETEIILGTNPAAPFVARIGDAVQIIIPGGPAAGTYAGTIIGGSSTVRAG